MRIQRKRSNYLEDVDSFDFAVRKIQRLKVWCADQIVTQNVNCLLVSEPIVMNMHSVKVWVGTKRLNYSTHAFLLAEILVHFYRF